MTIKFRIRVSKKIKEGDYAPLYVRLIDGVGFDQSAKTKILVQPGYWDQTAQGIKARCLCPMEERRTITNEISNLKSYLTNSYMDCKLAGKIVKDDWVQKAVDKYFKNAGKDSESKGPKLPKFDDLFTEFLSGRDICDARKRHYEVIRRMIHRYETYIKCSQVRSRYSFDVTKVDKTVLDDLYEYLENECDFVEKFPRILEDNPESREIKPRGENHMAGIFKRLRAFFKWLYETKQIESFPFVGFEMPSEKYGSPVYLTLEDVQKIYAADLSANKILAAQRDIFVFQCNVGCRVGDLLRLQKRDVINGAIEYIPSKTIKDNARTVVVPLNKVALEIIERYADEPGDQLLPFESSFRYNISIKEALTLAGVNYLVTVLDPVTRKEKKIPINEIASSHMARRTFIGNIYKLVQDPNLISALTGHVEGSRAFNRYRTIDIEMKQDLVKMLERIK